MRVAGIMSGTSLDGIDVAIVDIRGRSMQMVASRSTPYSKRLRQAIHGGADRKPAFFAPDRFRFGQSLERSELEIATQRAAGVDGVVCTKYRRRGLVALGPLPTFAVAARRPES